MKNYINDVVTLSKAFRAERQINSKGTRKIYIKNYKPTPKSGNIKFYYISSLLNDITLYADGYCTVHLQKKTINT